MKTCFNSDMKITQIFGNDFWIKPKELNSVYFIAKILKKGYPIKYTEEGLAYIDYKGDIFYIVKYYKQYGLDGHNGIDVVPKNKKDRSMFCMQDGIIKILKKRGAYGNSIAIWNPDKLITEYHNHLSEFNSNLKLNQEIKKETYIGNMGKTGACAGAHNHLAYARTDQNANRINRKNGFNGYIDPMPFLK